MTTSPSSSGSVRRLVGGALALAEAREDVGRERRDARAVGAHQVLDLLDEVEHRRARQHLGRDRRHRRVADPAGALHHGELRRRLRPPELVHERRAGDDAAPATRPPVSWITVSAQIRSPTASVLVVAEAARRLPRTARGPSSRSLTTTSSPGSSPATSNSVIIRGSTKTGSRLGAEEGARDPAVRVLRLAEGRDRRARRRSGTRDRRTAARKRRSTPASRIRSASRRLRSA